MKRTIIAVSISAAVIVASGYAQAQTFEQHFGGQAGVNKHFEGTNNRQDDQLSHLERATSGNKAWNGRQQVEIDANTTRSTGNQQHLDRVEGVLNAHRIGNEDRQRQIDDVKAHADRNTGLGESNQRDIKSQGQSFTDHVAAQKTLDQRQNDSIDNAHARIGGVKEQADKDRTASVQRDDRIEGESISRDNALGDRIGGVDADSRERDAGLASYGEQTRQMHAAMAEFNNQQWAQQMTVDAGQDARLDQHDRDISGLKSDVRELRSGIAGVAALNSVFDPNYDGLQSHVGTAVYGSGSAIGLSLGGKVSQNNFIHVGASLPNRGPSVFQAGWSKKW